MVVQDSLTLPLPTLLFLADCTHQPSRGIFPPRCGTPLRCSRRHITLADRAGADLGENIADADGRR